jgi:dienelactone hydrolase
VQAALKHNPRAESYVYPGIPHGFTAPGRENYDREASELSFERALRVLEGLKAEG